MNEQEYTTESGITYLIRWAIVGDRLEVRAFLNNIRVPNVVGDMSDEINRESGGEALLQAIAEIQRSLNMLR